MKYSKRKKYLYYLILAIFIMVMFYMLQSPVQIFFGYFTRPIYKVSANYLSFFTFNKQLINENKKLQESMKKIVVDYALLKELEKENRSLKKLLNYNDNPKYKTVVAEIIGIIPEIEKNVLLINKGENLGLQPNLPIISPNGILIGKIYKTDKFTSQIILLESPLFKTTAFIQNENNSFGLVEGTRNLGIRMNYIAQEEKLDIGDIVVTSGRDNFIPRGLVIGQISAIHKNEGNFFQSVSLTSPEKVQNLFYVNILVPLYE